MRISRRDMLRLAGGAAVGVTLSPLPWKLLDDVSIRTQGEGWAPKLPRGPITWRSTTCALCPAACGLRVRCAGSVPVSLVGTSDATGRRGALCAFGLAAHHLPYHPLRLTGPLGCAAGFPGAPLVPVTAAAAVHAMAAAVREAATSGTRVAVVDCRPGRSVSAVYRAFTRSVANGVYLAIPSGEDRSLETLAGILDLESGTLGVDLEGARAVLSFGAPVLEDWIGAGRLASLRAGPARPRVIQVETRPSVTAALADRWIRIRPGSEAVLALGMAHVIVRDGLADAGMLRGLPAGLGGALEDLLARFAPELAEPRTGVAAADIERIAVEVARDRPSIVVSGGDPGGGPLPAEAEEAIAILNLLLGAVGRRGGIVRRRSLPAPADLDASGGAHSARIPDLPDGSIGLLVLDGAAAGDALPWRLLARKLAARRLVVSLATHRVGVASRADFILPVPMWLEWCEECPTPPGAPVASLAVTAPLLSAPSGAVDPVRLLSEVAAAAGIPFAVEGDLPGIVRGRAERIHAEGRGSLIDPDGGVVPLASLASGRDAWERILGGARWQDDAPLLPDPGMFPSRAGLSGAIERLAAIEGGSPRPEEGRDLPLILMPFGARVASGESPLPALASKLHRESLLRPAPGIAMIAPETARRLGLRDGSRAAIETAAGRCPVRIAIDHEVLPGVVHVAVGPQPDRLGEPDGSAVDILSLCDPDAGGCWRAVPARIVEA